MQCSYIQVERDTTFSKIRLLEDGGDAYLLDSVQAVLPMLLGKDITEVSYERMERIWAISGKCKKLLCYLVLAGYLRVEMISRVFLELNLHSFLQ